MPLPPGALPNFVVMIISRRMQIFSPGDGLEGHFQAIFWIPWGVPPPMEPSFSLYIIDGATLVKGPHGPETHGVNPRGLPP